MITTLICGSRKAPSHQYINGKILLIKCLLYRILGDETCQNILKIFPSD